MAKLPAFVICSQTIERFFSKLKHFRAVTTRFEKHSENYLALVKLASAKIWMRSMSR
jgi:transposase